MTLEAYNSMEISYQGLFDTLKNKGIMQKTMREDLNLSGSIITRQKHKGGGGGSRIYNGSITDYECSKNPMHDFRRVYN